MGLSALRQPFQYSGRPVQMFMRPFLRMVGEHSVNTTGRGTNLPEFRSRQINVGGVCRNIRRGWDAFSVRASVVPSRDSPLPGNTASASVFSGTARPAAVFASETLLNAPTPRALSSAAAALCFSFRVAAGYFR